MSQRVGWWIVRVSALAGKVPVQSVNQPQACNPIHWGSPFITKEVYPVVREKKTAGVS